MAITRQALLRDFGSMADLPHEFANTIANIYYRYYAADQILARMAETHEESVKIMAELLRINRAFQFAPTFVEQHREMVREAHPSVLQVFDDFTLAVIKYGIEDAKINRRLD